MAQGFRHARRVDDADAAILGTRAAVPAGYTENPDMLLVSARARRHGR
ncbi:hypothetical protein [Stenotrophomonas rhizophila]